MNEIRTMAFLWLRLHNNTVRANHARKSVYFLRKTKTTDGRFLFFPRSLLGWSVLAHVAPLGHSTIGVPKRCEGFVAICCVHARSSRTTVFNSFKYQRSARSSVHWQHTGHGDCWTPACSLESPLLLGSIWLCKYGSLCCRSHTDTT